MSASPLDRFVRAQDDPSNGIATALDELRRGRKQRHWIWYVFPQLRGLGQSPAARTYGLAGVEEADAYLRDPVLRERLLAAAAEALAQVRRGVPLTRLMGAEIDVLKLVSSMTLFGARARRLADADPMEPEFQRLADVAEALLGSAAEEGFAPCAFTQARLQAAKG